MSEKQGRIQMTLTNDVGWCASYDSRGIIEGCHSEGDALRALAEWVDETNNNTLRDAIIEEAFQAILEYDPANYMWMAEAIRNKLKGSTK